jgi:hypothetical protein
MAAVIAAVLFAVLALARFAPAADEPRTRPAEAPSANAAITADTADPPPVAAAPPAESPLLSDDVAALFSFAPITDGVPRVRKPAQVRGIYVNAWAAGSPNRLNQLIELANRTEINTFVIDVKEGGQLSYASRIPLARGIGADQNHIRDIRGVLQKLRSHGIYPIARIVVFRDEVLAKARPDWAVRHVDGGDWIDAYGHYWVDSFNAHVWNYNIAIAREALELGFAEVQWDYVRFPDVPRALMRTADFPARDGRTMADGIREFLLHSRAQLAEYDAPVTADVFGLTVSARDDMGIGQNWEKMLDATDVLLPMVYPSHFARGSYGIAHPNAQPFDVIRTSLQHAVRRSAGVENAATIRPWLQDFTLNQPRYGPEHVRAQIDAVYEAGLEEWVLWNPGSRYTEAALASADGRVPVLPRPPLPPADDTADTDSAAAPRTRPLGTPARGG